MRRKAVNSPATVFTGSGQLYYIAPAYLSFVRTPCLCIKALPVKYFHTSCSQKVTKYFLSSLISFAVCTNRLTVLYPFLEVNCVLLHLAIQLLKLPAVPWRKGVFWENLKFCKLCPMGIWTSLSLQGTASPWTSVGNTWTISNNLSFAPWHLDSVDSTDGL